MARYKIGDAVRVLSYSDIQTKFDRGTKRLPSGCYFVEQMKPCCEKEFIVDEVISTGIAADTDVGFYALAGTQWCFTDEMLEDADNYQSSDVITSFSFDELMAGTNAGT